MGEEGMSAFMEEWMPARLRLGEPGPLDNSGDKYAECTTVPADVSWLSKNLHRIRSVVNEILAFFNVELPQFDNDNCWFFLHPDSKPKNWSWGRCLQLCFERLVRCGTWCNRHDIPIDTPDTIYTFCIFTICVIKCEIQTDDHNAELKEHYKKNYGGSLGLPMTLAYHDLLRLTIAHREHGTPIWSGFHKGCTSFSQFDDRGNHMLMETRTSNYAKHDFPVHTYNAIEQQIRECSIEKFGYVSKDELKINV